MVATRVAKFTDARTPGSLFNVRSTFFAHAAQDIPVTSSWTRWTCVRCSSDAAVGDDADADIVAVTSSSFSCELTLTKSSPPSPWFPLPVRHAWHTLTIRDDMRRR
ncbi:hypothetical protein MBOU_59780 [Mycobacterium bourgelatii]|uniref:Uncharacterized protein n=1 Tax=Mycobacterium bourgelatii TaxID=1273442 RepID=A0A7I9YZE7_MYCBU|nr:hypothetical protein MBOU_59780 [Mycobacterium bourgelatii]